MHASNPWVVVLALLTTSCGRVVQTSGATSGTGGSSASSTHGSSVSNAASTGAASSSTGASSTGSSSASSGGGQYSAFNLATNLPRYVVFKQEAAANRCVELFVSMHSGGGLGIQTTAGWAVDQALVTAHASDCALDANGYPIVTMQSTTAQNGTGTLYQQPTGFQPCSLNVHVSLAFPTGSPWAPPTDLLDADNVVIQGGGACGG